jgi:uncharacterized iron-regulated protein
MANRTRLFSCCPLLLCAWAAPVVYADEDAERPHLWVDVYQGEPVTYGAVLDDLRQARVIYLGERHTVQRHHDLEARIIADLAAKGVPLVVGLEQMETSHQPILDRFNRGEIDFDKLAELTEWGQRWGNYRQYRAAVEAARHAGAPLIGLNARPELIRQVARGGGVDNLPAQQRVELPADMQLKDPVYEKLLRMTLMVHMAATPDRVRPMIEAQIARDETMAAALAGYLNSEPGRPRTAVVLCGAGHVSYGLGTAQRVRRRLPGVRDRIVIFSESGDVKLSPEEQKAARDVEITHEQLRAIDRPIGDYLYATGLAPELTDTKADGEAAEE